jgi:PAS domain S-box-containing protein
MLRSEWAMIVIGAIALVSSMLLWWANNLSRHAYPNHVVLSDNLQQARRFVTQAVIFQGKHLAGEPVTAGEARAALDNAALKIRDCQNGRSTLQGVDGGHPPAGQTLVLLQSYREALARLDSTVRAQLVAKENVESMRIQQLKQFYETEQIANAVETEQALQLAAVIAGQQREQRVGLAFWLVFLLGSFFLLLRAARIEAAQAQQQQLIHALLESTADAVFVKDRAGRYLLCNEAAQRVIGKSADELIGQTDRVAFPPEIAERLMSMDREILESGIMSNHEEQVTTMGGETLVFMVAKGVVRDRDGLVVGLYGISRDVTKQRRDEEQLQRHRVMLQRTSRLAKVGGWEFDPKTLVGSWTEECARIHDLEPTAEMTVEQGLSYYQGEYRTIVEQAVREAVELGRGYDLELELVSAKGVRKWVRTQCEPLVEEGRVRHVYGALQDVTERKEAERALQRSNMALQEAQQLAEIGSWHWDLAAGRHDWSPEVYRIYGRDPEQPPLAYPEVAQYFAPESWRGLSQAVERCLRDGLAYTRDAEVTRPDGESRWITVRGTAGYGENGEVECLHGTVQDITERKQMEETLRESEGRYRTLFEQSMDAIALMDGFPPQFRYVNPAFVELFGYTEDEMRGMSGGDVWRLVHPEDVGMVREKVQERMDGKKSALRYEFRIVRKDGEIRWVEATGIRVESAGKAVNQAIYRDITGRKTAEEEQEKLLAQLMQAQKMESVGRLAGGVAHDFNNMLSVILGVADFVEEQLETDSPMRGDMQEIRKAAQRSVDLTRQLLAFARKQTVAPKVLNINATVEGLLKMLRRLIGEDIALVWAPAADLWSVRIDPAQVDQILANLCVNARDAIGGAGKLTIETGNVVFDEDYCADHLEFVPGEYILLAVSDDGCGMDKDTLAKIFDPFFTTKGMGEGTGLGLSTVYGIVRQNNGFVTVYSEPGQGTTLKIYLPRHGGEITPELADSGPAIPDGLGRTILLVEDEIALLQLNRRMLISLGYTVLAASTPREAIRLARESQDRIDLLLTDVVMPEMNGRELAAELHRFLPGLKQLFMSGYTANVIAHHGVLDDGVYFLQKPFLKKDLAGKITAVLADHSES